MSRFNLSEWAVGHRTLVVFLMLLSLAAGVTSYQRLGREEDPEFAVQTMIVETLWPGATAADTMSQITDAIEKKLQETPNLDYVRSFTKPGVSVVYVNLLQSTKPANIAEIWYQVRKKVADIRASLPQGIQGPFFNDEFGDVYGIIYGLTYDGFTLRETRDFAETAMATFQRAKDVGKVEIFGDQKEKIYFSFSPAKLAALGLDFDQVMNAIAAQNAVAPAGVINTRNENMLVEVSGALEGVAGVERMNLFINDRFYRLTDLGAVEHGYADPPSKMYRVNGKPAIGIGISMRPGGNNLEFGRSLQVAAKALTQQFPIGIDVVLVSDQPKIVQEAIDGFTTALFQAIAIVLGVSFLSLGLRAGLVVALSIPLVLAIVFVGMEMMQISLQRISLGALIIALGLLVDDAMITVEMMVSKIEEGLEKVKAATFAYTSTAFPMLTGTLVTIFGFWPIGFAQSNTGQYCFSLFAVIAIALVSSWFVAVVFAPVIGLTVLPGHVPGKTEGPAREGRFRRGFRAVLLLCMRRRYITLLATVVVFALALYGQRFVQRQFFPASDRTELLVTMQLPTNASIFATQSVVERLQKATEGDADIALSSAYVGGGAVRFYLPLDVQLDNDFIAQIVFVARDLAARDRLERKLTELFERDFADITTRVARLELGPPVGWPIQYRVSGSTPTEARHLAEQVADALRRSGAAKSVNFDWNEKNKTVRLIVDQDKARQVGLSSQALSQALNTVLTGQVVTQLRDSIYLIDLTARADAETRGSLDALRNLRVNLPGGGAVPIGEVVTFDYTLADGYLWRRDRLPTITVQADMAGGLEAPTVYARLRPALAEIGKDLPPSARIVEGGTVEKSAQSNAALLAQVPIMIGLMLIVLMVQLQSFMRLALVISVAPLGLIGVVAAMLTTHTPMGFVATLGIIALSGMIIRNSVILVDQIEHNRAEGQGAWEAVVAATQHRLRPILLTASAASLGMIPIMSDVFWGPMAFAVVGGLAGATLLTLLFLPALYIAVFRITEAGADGPSDVMAPKAFDAGVVS